MEFIRDGVLMFRHPLLPGLSPIRRGVKKLSGTEQGKIDDAVRWLMANKPPTRDAVPDDMELHPLAYSVWFDPLGKEEDFKAGAAALDAKADMEVGELKMATRALALVVKVGTGLRYDKAAWDDGTRQLVERLALRILAGDGREAQLQRDIESLNDQLEGVAKATGQALGEAKLLTLGDCLEHFKRNWKSKGTQKTYDDCVKRVGYIVDALGAETKHCEITRNDILDAIAATPHSVEMKRRLHSLARTFFGSLADDEGAGGLGLKDPSSSIEAPNRILREVITLDPCELIQLDIDQYWQTLAAVCGYAGLRLSEAAALEWDHVDVDAELIRVRETEVHPGVKTITSERDVRPFPNLWKFLKVHERKGQMVFWRNDQAESATWFNLYKGKPKADKLSAAFKEAIERAARVPLALALEDDDGEEIFRTLELPYEPALRLRHYWETSMRAAGHAGLIEAMGGHSNETGKKFYTRNADIVGKAKIKAL